MIIKEEDRALTKEESTKISAAVQSMGIYEHHELKNQVQKLQQWIADLQSGMYINCVYCGHRYGPMESTPVSMAYILKQHIQECDKHPMAQMKRALLTVREILNELCNELEI